jgi:hypothetical protein
MTEKPPSLMWLRDIGRQGMPKFKNMHRIKRSNVVMLVYPKLNSAAKRSRMMIGGSIHKLIDSVEQTDRRFIQLLSNTNPSNPFTHDLLMMTGFPGKLLVFSGWNMIRNGKYSQPEHLSLVIRYIRRQNRPWYSGIAIPNNVVSANFETPVDRSIANNSRAVSSRKYPGINIVSARKMAEETRCTPTFYTGYNAKDKKQKRSTVNFAGAKSAEDLLYHIKLVDDISVQYPSSRPLHTSCEDDENNDEN